MHREILIKQINDRSDQIIKELNDKEIKCKENKKNLQKINLNNLKNDILTKRKHQLRNSSISKIDLNNLFKETNENIETINTGAKVYKSELIMNQKIEFEKYERSSLFGQPKINPNTEAINLKNFNCKMMNQTALNALSSLDTIKPLQKSNSLIKGSKYETKAAQSSRSQTLYNDYQDEGEDDEDEDEDDDDYYEEEEEDESDEKYPGANVYWIGGRKYVDLSPILNSTGYIKK